MPKAAKLLSINRSEEERMNVEWISDRPPTENEVRVGETTMATLRNGIVVSWSGPTLRAEWARPGEFSPIAWLPRPEPYTPPTPTYRCPMSGCNGSMEPAFRPISHDPQRYWCPECGMRTATRYGKNAEEKALADVQKLCKQEPVENLVKYSCCDGYIDRRQG